MGTSFGAKISGIVRVDKRYLWLVNGCPEYHRPIITSACPLKRSQTSLRPKLVPILLHVSEVRNLRNLFISLSSIHLSTGLRGLKTTQRQGWRRAESEHWIDQSKTGKMSRELAWYRTSVLRVRCLRMFYSVFRDSVSSKSGQVNLVPLCCFELQTYLIAALSQKLCF